MNSMIKVAWIDIDDISLSFLCGFNSYLKNLGYPINKSYIPKTWDYNEILGDKIGEIIQPFIENQTYDLQPFPEAAEFIDKLRGKGYRVNFITAHPAHLTKTRLENLARYNIKFDNFYTTTFYNTKGEKQSIEKAEFIKLLGYGDLDKYHNLFIDDKFSSVVKFVESGLGVGASINRSYNYEDIANCPEEIMDKILLSRTGRSKTQQVHALYKMVLNFI